MATPTKFYATTGKDRYRAILERYDRGEIGPQMACEYLAELLMSDGEFDEQQEARILAAYALVHELSDGATITSDEFETALPAR
jgi:hypothetical protein